MFTLLIIDDSICTVGISIL